MWWFLARKASCSDLGQGNAAAAQNWLPQSKDGVVGVNNVSASQPLDATLRHNDRPMADDTQREVLSNLPRARRQRRSAKRGDSPTASSRGADGSASSAERAGAAERAAGGAKKRTTAGAKKRAATGAKATPISKAPSSRARRQKAQEARPAQQPPPAGWATPEDAGGAPPSGLEIVTTGVRAVGELGQLGAAVAGQAVKGLLSRLPRP